MKKKTIKTKQTTKRMKFDQSLSKIIIGLVVVSSLLLMYKLFRLGVLSNKYLIPAVLILIVLSSVLSFWLIKSKGHASKILSLIVVVAILLGVNQVARIRNLIANVTGANKETHVVHVIVMDQSPYKTIDDLKGLNVDIAANTAADKKYIDLTVDEINNKDKVEFNLIDKNNYLSVVNSLYDGEVEAILLSEAHRPLMEEYKPEFEEETRIIASYYFEEEVEEHGEGVDVTKDTFSIFVTGIDTYGPLSSVSRSDVNMIVTVNPKTNQILLTSIPRDYHVTLHSFGQKDKLTHAGIYGVRESMKTLEDLLSSQVNEKVDIDYYLRVNFTSVIDIVDALGGVEVYSRYNFNVGNYSYVQGMNHVYGNEALAFVRERYSLPNGDFDRIQNQQALITGVINKAASPAIITNFNKFLNSVGGSFELSMSDKDFNKLAKKQIDTMSSWEIIDIQLGATGSMSTNTYSMPGWNLYVAEPKYDTVKAAAEMILKMERGEIISKQADWPY